VADEDVGEVARFLQALEQVEHLGLDRDVQRADRLIADDQLGLERQCAGNADALTLPTTEFVRVYAGMGNTADTRSAVMTFSVMTTSPSMVSVSKKSATVGSNL
jgi:hypothetical protein